MHICETSQTVNVRTQSCLDGCTAKAVDERAAYHDKNGLRTTPTCNVLVTPLLIRLIFDTCMLLSKRACNTTHE
eukprot:3811621-Amphidinium_carterae.1